LLVMVVTGTAQSPDQLVSVEFGTVSIAAQIDRLMVFVLMGLITTTIVYRMQRLVELSGRDGLTGLPNRLWLSQRMPRIVDDARADGRSLTLALLELDRFRRISDEIDTRDVERVVRQIAALFGEMLECDDHLARIGGHEFVLVLHSPVGSAWERLDRLRRTLAERPFISELGSESQRITLSAGLVSCPQDGSTLSTLLRSADRRLQQAKRDGGNRLIARES
jgi:two-component system cell cycle response regulator